MKKIKLFSAWMLLTIFPYLVTITDGLPGIVKIGGLFDISDTNLEENVKPETVFRRCVEMINHQNILPNSTLSSQIERVPATDPFHTAKRACHLLKSGVAAIFGPQSGSTSSQVQSICDAHDIPHIQTRWDLVHSMNKFSVNLMPSPILLSQAYKSLVESYGWKSFTLLYQDNYGLMRLQELITSTTRADVKIEMKRLNFKNNDENKRILREVKQSGEIYIVLDCDVENVITVLREAKNVGMMTAYHNYLITNLDLHLVDMEEFKYGGTNITSLRLVDPYRNNVQTDIALLYDAVMLFATALAHLDLSQIVTMTPLSCSEDNTWEHGNSLINYMKMADINGLTGRIKFDEDGLRTDFELEIVELKKHGLDKVGIWHDVTGINFFRNFTETYSEIVESLQNKTLVVTTIMSPPYSMFKESVSGEKLVGNDAFEGYAIDLIQEIAKILKFNYTFKWVDDGAYGYKNKETGEWNGLMGELLSQKADLAIADLSITYEREKAVDFSNPFMTLGISILYRKPRKQEPALFAFMSPLDFEVWIYMVFAYFIVSILLFILARFSPYEWDNPHPCNEQEVLVNEFSLCNSMWFTVGSLMQQGSDLTPKSISTRMIAAMWWFFTLIMISSYTANLAAFLTVERMESPIESAEDLAKQTKIKYGCLESGSTRAFFRDAKNPTFARMKSFMESQKDSVFMKSNHAGVTKVINSDGDYAFLMESNSIQYQIERMCDLIQVGQLLDSKGYGIAFTPGSHYRVPIDRAILQLQEDGVLHQLKNRWWKERRGGGQCDKETRGNDNANELTLDSVGGVFVVLIAGMGIACAISVLEFIWKGSSLEKKAKVKPRSLVAKALYNTNSNLFNIAGIQKETKQDQTACPHGRKRSISAGMTPIPLTGRGQNLAGDLILQSRGHSPMFKQNNMDYLDLNSDPYGPMSGPPPPIPLPLPAKIRSRSPVPPPAPSLPGVLARSSHSLCGAEADLCGPLASHPFCATHCTSKHITYQSNNSCFGALQC